jgi:mycothiol synthase
MTESDYIIRNYRPSDLDEFTRLYVTVNGIPAASMTDVLERPGFTAGKDLFLVEKERLPVGYAHLTPEPEIDRVIVRCWIQPSHRRKGLAKEFLIHIIRRCKELGIKAVHAYTPQADREARSILPKLGFHYIRRYLDLELDVNGVSQEELDEAGRKCRRLRPGEEKTLVELQNRAFSRHWGYNPNTLETITHDINMNNRSPEDVIFACDGETVTGYCWTEIAEVESSSGKVKQGIINMIGTEPEYRGRGLGKRVLFAAIAYLKDKGARSVGLTVDAENRVALELYRSTGFRECGSTLWYEKLLS